MLRDLKIFVMLMTLIFIGTAMVPIIGAADGDDTVDVMPFTRALTRADLHVGGGQTYTTIADAIDAASDGDTIVIHSGTYTENVIVDKELTLTGQGGTEPIIQVSAGNGITIRADNVTIHGLEIQGADTGISSDMSGMTITENIFQSPNSGIYWHIDEDNHNEDLLLYPTVIRGNTFNTPVSFSIYIRLDIDYLMAFPHDVEIRSIVISQNYFYMNGTTSYGIYMDNGININGLAGGTIDMGDIEIIGNMICGGNYGIRFSGRIEDIYSTQVLTGDINVKNNLFVNQINYGMQVRAFQAEYWHGESVGTYGNTYIRDNVLMDQQDIGIRMEVAYLKEFYYNASLATGEFNVSGNTIDSFDDGIYAYLSEVGRYMSGTSSIQVGKFSLYGNTITSAGQGIYFNAQNIGTYLYDDSTVRMNSISILENEIIGDMGVDLHYFNHVGGYMYGNSSFMFEDLEVGWNDITATGSVGIYCYRYRYWGDHNEGDSTAVFGNFMVNDNTIVSDGRGIRVYQFSYLGNEMGGSATLTIGDIQFLRNDIESSTEGILLEILQYWGYYISGSSSVHIGNVLVEENEILSGDNSIDLGQMNEIGKYMSGSSSFTMGDVHIDGNDLESTSNNGFYLGGFNSIGYQNSGTSEVTIGKFTCNDNLIDSSDEGIDYNSLYDVGCYLYDSSSFTMGDIEIKGNEIGSDDDGIYVAGLDGFGNDLYDSSSVTLGSIDISGNTVVSALYGIYVYVEYFGCYLYGDSVVSFESVLIEDNIIDSIGESIYIEYIEYFGSYNYGNSLFTMDDISVSENNVTSEVYGIYCYYIEYFGYEVYGSSVFKMGNIHFDDNIIFGSGLGYGLGVQYIQYFGSYMYVNSSFTMGDITFNGNDIKANGDGIYVEYLYEMGYENYGTSTFLMGTVEMIGNTIYSDDYYGIYLYEFYEIGAYLYDEAVVIIGDLSISDNIINSSYQGIFIEYYQYIGYELYGGSSFEMGEMHIDGNEIVSRNYGGVTLEYFGYLGTDLYGDNYVEIGDMTVNDNVIWSIGNGVDISTFEYVGYDVEVSSEVVMGDFSVDGNTIYSDGAYGIDLSSLQYFGYDLYNNGRFTFGNISFSGNDIISDGNGIWLYFYEMGYGIYDNSYGRIEGIQVDDNTIVSKDNGIFVDYFYDIGRYIEQNGFFEMGEFSISGNDITCEGSGIYHGYVENVGADLDIKGRFDFGGFRIEDNVIDALEEGIFMELTKLGYSNEFMSSFNMDGIDVLGNDITAGGDGINITFLGLGEDSEGMSTIDIGGIAVSDNIVSCKIGIALNIEVDVTSYVELNFGQIDIQGNTITDCTQWGISLDISGWVEHNATAIFGAQNVDDNLIRNAGDRGISVSKHLEGTPYTTFEMGSTYITRNIIDNNPVGVYLDRSIDNYAYLNSFTENTVDTESIHDDTTTTWCSDEPIRYKFGGSNYIKLIGNYWDDYTGSDTNGDGIGESPYAVVDEFDNYPLVGEGSSYYPPIPDLTDPTVSIINPSDGSFLSGDDIDLIWDGADVGWGLDLFMVKLDDSPWMDKGLTTTHYFADILEGDHTFTVMALDLGGNMKTDTVSVVIDITDPIVNITAPFEGGMMNGEVVDLTWNTTEDGSGIEAVEIRLDDGNWTDLGDVNATQLTDVPDGEHTIELLIRDLAGNSGRDSIDVTIDNTAPIITVNYPVKGAYLSVNAFAIDWTVADTGVGIDMVELKIGMGEWIPVDDTGIFNLTELGEGVHNFTVQGRDLVGNMMEEFVEFSVDTIDPTLVIDVPIGGSTIGSAVTVSWTGDGTGSPETYEIKLDDDNWTEASQNTSRQFTNLTPGEHVVQVMITDSAGNSVTETTVFTVDITLPEILSAGPTGGSVPINYPVEVEFNKQMNVDAVTITVNGADMNITWEGFTASYLPEGGWQTSTLYNIEVNGADRAGNPLETYEWAFTTSGSAEVQGTIVGLVVNEEGEPLEGAMVKLDSGEEAFTDENGVFRLTGSQGTHDLTISLSGYDDLEFKVVIAEGETDLAEISLDKEKEASSSCGTVVVISMILLLLLLAIVVVIFVLRRKKDDFDFEGDDEDDMGWDDEDEDEDEDYEE